MTNRKPEEICLSLENCREAFRPGDIIVEAEELGQVVSARPDVRNEWIVVYFMGGDCYKETFGPQTLTVLREQGLPEYEWSGRPIGTHVMVEISKAGGGSVGRRYSGDWKVRITQNGRVICEDVMRYAARSLTHEEAAKEAYCFVDDAYAADHRD